MLLIIRKRIRTRRMEDFVAGEALASQFEFYFSLIACMVSSAMGSVWYLDNGASFHMTVDKELFSDLEETVQCY